jgi:hypothetical protein
MVYEGPGAIPWSIRGWRESAFGLEGIKGLGTVSGESVKKDEKAGSVN